MEYFALRTSRGIALIGTLATWIICMSHGAFAQTSRFGPETWSNTFYGGIMTTNKADELFSSVERADNDLIGYSLAYDLPLLNSPWSFGFELQFTYHFGDQDYAEIGLPLTVRYRWREPWAPWLEGVAFGLGMSHATKVPQVEVDTRGGSRRNLIYWMFEAEFKTSSPQTSWFIRVHHRSDAWGTLKPEGGSNAIVLGVRQDF